jgi:hypothetical protein
MGIIARDRTAVFGGNGSERTPYHPEIAGAGVFGFSQQTLGTPMGFRGEVTPGDTSTRYGGSWSGTNLYTSGRIMQFGDTRDDATNTTSAMRLSWSNTNKLYQFLKQASSRITFAITGNGFSSSGYTQNGDFLLQNGLLIGDGALTSLVKIGSAANLGAITGAVVLGQIWFYKSPTAGGKIGAVCTTAGTVGSGAVLKEFGAIDA